MKRYWPFLLAVVLVVVLMLGILFRSYADRLPGTGRMCEPGLGVAGGARSEHARPPRPAAPPSRPRAATTRDAVAKVSTAQESSGADTFQVRSFDPLTKGDLAFSCVRTEVIRCEGPAGEVVVIAR